MSSAYELVDASASGSVNTSGRRPGMTYPDLLGGYPPHGGTAPFAGLGVPDTRVVPHTEWGVGVALAPSYSVPGAPEVSKLGYRERSARCIIRRCCMRKAGEHRAIIFGDKRIGHTWMSCPATHVVPRDLCHSLPAVMKGTDSQTPSLPTPPPVSHTQTALQRLVHSASPHPAASAPHAYLSGTRVVVPPQLPTARWLLCYALIDSRSRFGAASSPVALRETPLAQYENPPSGGPPTISHLARNRWWDLLLEVSPARCLGAQDYTATGEQAGAAATKTPRAQTGSSRIRTRCR
ncbi:hypothetical protein HYPSUDRAFT_200303 [Hypholoma sublateritium FD-334 SS-4]|uniref:Uncharacterized protein n=1 Tax=Hypholoma sublateritium (strain FD-334 SS-4) TaxID=945553 RepID=A0A0D2P1H8_HYPSF|nr:hypothetical protein HYPSUDRAFT_200303 [Hypholoma sublateritium FD-334 SS-4]